MDETNGSKGNVKTAASKTGGNGNGARTILGVTVDPDAIKQKAELDLKAAKQPTKTDVYQSIFRVKHDETPRSRTLGVLSNVFLHLHPAKVNRDAVRFNFTWGMGGITFLSVLGIDLDRRSADVLLPSDESAGFPRHPLSRARRAFRQVFLCAICTAGRRTRWCSRFNCTCSGCF